MSRKLARLAPGIALLAAVLLAYSNHFRNDFHFDDAHTIVNNAYIRSLGNIPRFFLDAGTSSSLPANQTYRPVVTATLAIDYALGKGLDPFWFHLSTFVLFLAQGVCMYLMFRRILESSGSGAGDTAALLAVAWYLLHPANAETVNYVIARSDTLSTQGIVAMFALYVCAPRSRKYHLYLIPAAIGALAKPVGVVFAPLLLVYELAFGEAAASGREGRGARGARGAGSAAALRSAAPAFVMAALLLVVHQAMAPKTWIPGGPSRYHYAITQPFVILHYFAGFFVPTGLSADTDWKPLATLLDVRFFAGSAFLALLLLAAAAALRSPRWRAVGFGLAWFLIGVFPTSFVFPLAEVLNDHRVFLPYVGLSLAAVRTVVLLVEHAAGSGAWAAAGRRAAAAAAVLLLGLSAWGTHRRNEVWRTDETLWRDVTANSPGNGRGWMNYGLAQMARGDFAGAERSYRRALELVPTYSYLHINLGIVQAATGREREAEASFVKALGLQPATAEQFFYYARFLSEHKRDAEAAPLLIKALSLAPAHLQARQLLLRIYREAGDYARLAALAEESLRIAPGDAEALAASAAAKSGRSGAPPPPQSRETPESLLNLSLGEYRAGRYRECILAAERALALRPDYDAAYNNVCAAHNELGEWEQARAACEKAVALNPSNQLARNNLEVALRGIGSAR